MRISYDTSIKHLYRKGLECALPDNLRAAIPKTNVHRWKNEAGGKYFGEAINEIAAHELDTLVAFAQAKNFKRMFRAYCRVSLVVKNLVGREVFVKLLQRKKQTVVELIDRVKTVIPLQSLIRALGISRTTYQNWLAGVKVRCKRSFFEWCNRRHPQQATQQEMQTIKTLLLSKDLAYWPVYSIAVDALKQGQVCLSPHTWYKYAKLLGITRPKPASRRKKSKKGIRASKPDELWHADVTCFDIGPVRYYIYLVVDNFSRKILAWKVSDRLRANIRMETLKMAFKQALKTGRKLDVSLIVDSGPENAIESFIENMALNIQKLTALKDISFSNSLVEAHNKLIKYNCLYRKDIQSKDQLEMMLNEFIQDFNVIRPHVSLFGYTPEEAYYSEAIDKTRFQQVRQKAKMQRKETNRNNVCGNCQ